MAPARMSIDVRPAVDSDLGAILAINASEVPRVGALDEDGLAHLVAEASWTLVAQTLETPVGFILALEPGADYASPNYRFFERRYADEGFCYVDRLAVVAAFRRQGIGASLYDAVAARTRQPWLTCEVNVDPPNPGSMAFHARLGFQEVARRDRVGTGGGAGPGGRGAKRVALLARCLAP